MQNDESIINNNNSDHINLENRQIEQKPQFNNKLTKNFQKLMMQNLKDVVYAKM